MVYVRRSRFVNIDLTAGACAKVQGLNIAEVNVLKLVGGVLIAPVGILSVRLLFQKLVLVLKRRNWILVAAETIRGE